MSAVVIHGICVSIKDEVIAYRGKDGDDSFRNLVASFVSLSGEGEPVNINLTEENKAGLKAFQAYTFPVEIRAGLGKKGSPYVRMSIPANAKILPLSQHNPASNLQPK